MMKHHVAPRSSQQAGLLYEAPSLLKIPDADKDSVPTADKVGKTINKLRVKQN